MPRSIHRFLASLALLLAASHMLPAQEPPAATATPSPASTAAPMTGPSAIASPAVEAVFNTGDIGPAGGIVFHDKGSRSDGWRYLEAFVDGVWLLELVWNNGSPVDIPGAKGREVGSGRENTRAIIAAVGEGDYAAAVCARADRHGFSDWFLPSAGELDLLYRYLKQEKPAWLKLMPYWCWSSSQVDDGSGHAWVQYFEDGNQDYEVADALHRVIPCRAF